MRLRVPRSRRWRLVATVWLLVAPSCLCRQITGLEIDGGGQMTPPDAGLDAGFDGGLDAGPDTGADAGEGAGPDAGEDAGFDAGPMGLPDAGYGKCGAGSELTSYVTYGDEGPHPNGRVEQYAVGPHLVASADMNGDGVLDLIEYEQDVSFDIWFGLLDGGMGSRTTYDAGGTFDGRLEYLAVGDVNGDGRPDLVVWDHVGLLSVYLNDGGGGLNPGATAQASSFIQVVAIGDLN